MKRILFSHSDLDGLGSIVLAKHFNLPFDEIYSVDYEFEYAPKYRGAMSLADEIIIADLSMDERVFDEFTAMGKKIIVYDHHSTSSWLRNKEGSVHDEGRCGTKIFFQEYVVPIIQRFKPCVREFVDLVDVYDRWVLESPLRSEAENLQRVWSAYASWRCPDNMARHDRFITMMSKKFDSASHFYWTKTELNFIKTALDKEQASYQQALDTIKIRFDSKGKKFGIWKAWGRISSTAAKLLNRPDNDLDYVICLQDSPDSWGKVSARCLDGHFEVTKLASVGGHLAAGGTTLSGEEANTLWVKNYCFKYAEDWQEGTTPIEICRN